MNQTNTPQRGRLLTILAILFAILAISNFLKPFQIGGSNTGLVLFGIRLSGFANAIAGPLFGLYLATYAYGMWNMRRFALPMSHFYATYVFLNLAMWTMITTPPPGVAYQVFGALYAIVALGVSVTAAVVLTRRKDELTA